MAFSKQLGVGGMGHRLGLHGAVDRDTGHILRLQCTRRMRDPQGLGQQGVELAANALAPMADP